MTLFDSKLSELGGEPAFSYSCLRPLFAKNRVVVFFWKSIFPKSEEFYFAKVDRLWTTFWSKKRSFLTLFWPNSGWFWRFLAIQGMPPRITLLPYYLLSFYSIKTDLFCFFHHSFLRFYASFLVGLRLRLEFHLDPRAFLGNAPGIFEHLPPVFGPKSTLFLIDFISGFFVKKVNKFSKKFTTFLLNLLDSFLYFL